MNQQRRAWHALNGVLFDPHFDPTPVDEHTWMTAISLANQLLVGPTLAHRLQIAGVTEQMSKDLADYVCALRTLTEQKNRAMLAQTEEIASRLNGAGLEPMVFKGIALLLQGRYEHAGARYVGDIDLVVPEDQVGATQRLLLELGYREFESNIDPAAHWHAHPMVHETLEICVEIHHSMLPASLHTLLDPREVWSGARPASLGQGKLQTPNWRHALILAVLHSEVIDAQLDEFLMPMRAIADVHALSVDAAEMPDQIHLPGVGAAALRRFAAGYTKVTGQPNPYLPAPRFTDRVRAELSTRALSSTVTQRWLSRYQRLSPPPLDRLSMTRKELRRARLRNLGDMWRRHLPEDRQPRV